MLDETGAGSEGTSRGGFEVFTAVNTKMAVFWVAAPCRLIIEEAGISETLAKFYQTIRSYNPENSLPHTSEIIDRPCTRHGNLEIFISHRQEFALTSLEEGDFNLCLATT
jgi:hypothetical protein